MSFARDKAAMLRLLRKSGAAPELVRDFEDICHYRGTETAEDLMRTICIRHGFTEPYTRAGQRAIIRPCCLGQDHPGHHADDSGNDPVAEQSYRRGYDQGGQEVLDMVKSGASLEQIEQRLKKIHQWRVQPIHFLHASPGCTTPQELARETELV